MRVFVYCTVKLFWDTGVVSDHKRSTRPRVVHMPQVINALGSRIIRNPLTNKKSWLRKWILHQEP